MKLTRFGAQREEKIKRVSAAITVTHFVRFCRDFTLYQNYLAKKKTERERPLFKLIDQMNEINKKIAKLEDILLTDYDLGYARQNMSGVYKDDRGYKQRSSDIKDRFKRLENCLKLRDEVSERSEEL